MNRLGDRLRKAQSLAEDSETLDTYRETFVSTYEFVIHTLRSLGLEPSGRIKTAISIVEKLKRESIRLSKLQDIAGCRLIVKDIARQDRVVEMLKGQFPNAKIMDRRQKESHGYRAVHVIVDVGEKQVEIQVRTELQQLWAVWSEALANRLDHSIKYGGGPSDLRELLASESSTIAFLESQQRTEAVSTTSSEADAFPPGRLAGSEQKVKERLTREILKLKAQTL